MSNRAMATLIESRIRNHAATRPETGVRAHGAAYHARRAHQDRLAAQQEAFGNGLERYLKDNAQPHVDGGVEAWRAGVGIALPRDDEDSYEFGQGSDRDV